MRRTSTIYMALLGPHGLEQVASASHQNTLGLIERLTAIDDVERLHSGAVFHEAAVSLPRPAREIIEALAEEKIVAGYDLGRDYPGLESALLVCATETKTQADIERFGAALAAALAFMDVN